MNENIMSLVPQISVQPDKFLFDYKILIVAAIILIASIVIACKKKTLKKAMINLWAAETIVTIIYIYNRIYDTSNGGYRYFLETNSDFSELILFVFEILILFLVLFVGGKIIDKIKGGK
jgi:hypothetical protein